MAQDSTEQLETQLAIEILNLFQRECLTAKQAKSLIERVRVLTRERLGYTTCSTDQGFRIWSDPATVAQWTQAPRLSWVSSSASCPRSPSREP